MPVPVPVFNQAPSRPTARCVRPDRLRVAAYLMAAGLGALACGGAALAQTNYPEVEPNDSKATATAVTLAPGDSFSGYSTGINGAVGTDDTYDYFRVKMTPAPPGIYRYSLRSHTTPATFSSDPVALEVSVRTLSQSNGVIDVGSDPDHNLGWGQYEGGGGADTVHAWYGFGREEEIYLRIYGLPPQVVGKTYTLTREPNVPVTPTAISQPVTAGPVTITVTHLEESDWDSAIWLYDANYNAIPGAGNDDADGVGGSSYGKNSQLTRILAPGTYYLAIGTLDLVNNLPIVPDDVQQNGYAMDFPGTLMTGSYPGGPFLGQVTLNDSTLTQVEQAFIFGGPYNDPDFSREVAWVQFTVVGDPPAGDVLISQVGPSIVDDAAGNNTGVADPGEANIGLSVPLVNAYGNTGGDIATNVSATLTSLTPTATIITGSVVYPDLAVNISTVGASPFVISLDPSHPCGQPVNLRLDVVSDQESKQTDFVLPTGLAYPGCATFSLGGSIVVDDTSANGNANGIADPGESALHLAIPVSNGGGMNAAVSATLTSLTPTATVVSGASTYPDFVPGDTQNNISPFVIALDPSHLCGAPIDLRLTITTDAGLGSGQVDFSILGATVVVASTHITSPGTAIPNQSPAGIDVPIEVPSGVGLIQDLNLRTGTACGNNSSIDHNRISELVITLTSPQGTSVVILNQQGGSTRDICNAIFDDEAAVLFPACGQPHSCSHQPFSPLSAFDGEDPTGTWTLNIADVTGSTSGSIRAGGGQPFSLVFSSCESPVAGCPADFNGVNGVTVQDIFDFLTAWLAGNASADFNNVNGVTVQDIFDFLTAWLAGC